MAKLNDARVEIIRGYTKNWSDLSDSTANDLGKRFIVFQTKRIALRGKYFNRISKNVSPIVAAKFFRSRAEWKT